MTGVYQDQSGKLRGSAAKLPQSYLETPLRTGEPVLSAAEVEYTAGMLEAARPH